MKEEIILLKTGDRLQEPLFRAEENGQVLISEEHNIWTHYDMECHTKIIVDKESILADGEDSANITMEVYNYLGEKQKHPDVVEWEVVYDDEVVAEHMGDSVQLSTLSMGEHTIRTKIPKFGNGEVKIYGR